MGGPTAYRNALAATGAAPNTMIADVADTVRLWDLSLDHAVTRICASTGGVLTPERWARYIPQLPYDPPCRHQS